ncbi:unnamed protein product [Toxocara canis]|uniref:Uncharacterized protein n=1 Tax=Toxocara canis TaxID=6265 RepID=A0A183VER7_TOXCA|nr:unnamed protein product [Toxocara canis]
MVVFTNAYTHVCPLQSPTPLLHRSAEVITGPEGYASGSLCSGRFNQAGQASRGLQGNGDGIWSPRANPAKAER